MVGHSFGGLVARAAAIERPAAFASLTLLGSGPAGIPVGPRVERMRLLDPVLERGGMTAVADLFTALAAADPTRPTLPPSVVAFLRERFVASSAAGLRGMGEALLSEPDRVAALRATGLPVLVAHGEYDDAWPPAVQRDMAQRLGATYAVLRGAMHSPAAEAPRETATLLTEFWAGVERSAGAAMHSV